MEIIFRWKNFNYMLELLFKKSLTETFGCPEELFLRDWCPKDTQTPCWLQLTLGNITQDPVGEERWLCIHRLLAKDYNILFTLPVL